MGSPAEKPLTLNRAERAERERRAVGGRERMFRCESAVSISAGTNIYLIYI